MRHNVFGRKLSRSANERRRLFQNLVREMIQHGKIKTTYAKAKAVQPLVEKLVTRAKGGSEHDRRRVLRVIDDRVLTSQLFSDAKTQFATRTSGFTRVVKLGMRRGDATEEALLMFVDEKIPTNTTNVPDLPKETKKPVRKPRKVAKKTTKK